MGKRGRKKSIVLVEGLPTKALKPKPKKPTARELRVEEMYRVFRDCEGTMAQKVDLIQDCIGCSRATVYNTIRSHKFEDRLINEKALLAQDEEKAAMMAKLPPVMEGVTSLEEIAKDLKNFAGMAVKISFGCVVSSARMINFWQGRLDTLVHLRGGLEYLTENDSVRVKAYEEKIMYYHNLAKDYLKPAGVAKYLDLLNMKEALQIVPEGNELGTLTGAGMNQLLEKLGITASVGKESMLKDIEQEVFEMGVEIPDLDGTVK